MKNLHLPVIDLTPLLSSGANRHELQELAEQLGNAFEKEGFAYLINPPLHFDHGQVLKLAKAFFQVPEEEKWRLAKKSFRQENSNTYRGYSCLVPSFLIRRLGSVESLHLPLADKVSS